MSEQKLLPVRLRPESGEHFSAYLLRLAIANGRASVRELFSMLGIKGTKARNHQSHNTLETLAKWIGLTLDDLKACIVREGILAKISAYDSSRIYRNLELRVPRICTACLQNGALIPAYFGQLPFTHCLTHGHELIHICPHCQVPFEWSEELFECRCPACNCMLDEATSAVTLRPYAAALVARQSDQIGLNNYVRDLLLGLQCVLEPFNSDLATRERPPEELAHWPTLLDQAYSLLTDTDVMASWIGACQQHRSVTATIGTSAVLLPIYTLKEKLALPWPVRDLDCHTRQQSLSRQAVERNPSLAPIDHHLLSKVLGCNPSEILPLIESAALEGIKGHRSVRDARFALYELASQIERLETEAIGAFVDMARAASIASVHGGNIGHVLAGVLLKEIPFKPKPGRETLLDGAIVGLEGLLAYMAKHFASLETTQLTLRETVAITGLNTNEITEACTLRLIKPLGWRRDLCFLGGDISRLLSTHVSIKRWSKISGISTRQLLAGFSSLRFQVSIEGVLYKRTKELDAWIDSYAES